MVIIQNITVSGDKKSPPEYREMALAYYGTVKEVYRKFQGLRLCTCGPMKRINQMEYERPDRIKIVDMPFDLVFVDDSAR